MASLMAGRGAKWIAGGWAGFVVENTVLSENRSMIIEELGDTNYHRLYNTLSTCALSSIAYGYWRHGRGARRSWVVGGGGATLVPRVAASFAIQAVGLIGFSQMIPGLQAPVTREEGAGARGGGREGGFRAQCPIDFKSRPGEGIHGAERVTRHVGLWSFALCALGPAIASPYSSLAVLCYGPTFVAFMGGAHKDMRYRRGLGGELTEATDAETSHVPFVAFLTGAQSWSDLIAETKPVNAGVAVAIALLMATRRASFMRAALR